ncbi:MAG TPA: carbohydrate porin [Longimicrobium sp.]|nr:carbohydrate porin [Longimicrobium sp.]
MYSAIHRAAGTGGRRSRASFLIRRRSSTPPAVPMPGSAATRLLLCATLCLPLPLRAQSAPAPADTAGPPAGAAAAEPAQEAAGPFTTEIRFAQFVQGPVAGGRLEKGEYGGRLEMELKVDTRKLGLWAGGTLDALVATRYGESASPHTGAAVPVNIALIDPTSSGTATSLTALNYTQLFPFGKPGNAFVVALGRFSTLAMVPDATGMTGYLNVAQLAPTHEARNIPAVTLGAVLDLVLGGEPVATLLVIDSRNSQMTSGLSELFANGVTVSPAFILPTRFFGKGGHQGLRATWSSQEITPFDEIPHLILPRPDTAVTVEKESGGWSLTYTADQYLQESPGPPHTGWRLYWQAGVADEETNPIGRYFNVGIGGTSPFRGRGLDRFGVAWAYTGFSGDFKELLGRLVEIEDEQSLEMFYNVALAPWIRFTGDLQVVWPFLPGTDTAIVPGARLQLVF